MFDAASAVGFFKSGVDHSRLQSGILFQRLADWECYEALESLLRTQSIMDQCDGKMLQNLFIHAGFSEDLTFLKLLVQYRAHEKVNFDRILTMLGDRVDDEYFPHVAEAITLLGGSPDNYRVMKRKPSAPMFNGK